MMRAASCICIWKLPCTTSHSVRAKLPGTRFRCITFCKHPKPLFRSQMTGRFSFRGAVR